MNRSTTDNFDAIVVGSGLTGSWLAMELTLGGMKVALLDAGSILDGSVFSLESPRNDLFNPLYHLFRLKLLLKGDKQRAFSNFVDNKTYRFFLERSKDLYVTPEGREFNWSRVRVVGGRGHFWGRVMLRPTDKELSIPGFEWPISCSELGPHYSRIERVLHVGGAESGSPEVPDGEYVHTRFLNPLEELFCESVQHHWPFRRAVVNHVAGYEPGPLSPMLKAALATGKLKLFPNKVVTGLTLDGIGQTVSGVISVCSKTGAVQKFKSRYIGLAASAFETIRILLNSKSEYFTNGVGNSNNLVGTRILENINVGVLAKLPAHLRVVKRDYKYNPFKLNSEPNGFYIPPFSHLENPETSGYFGYGIQGSISPNSGLFYLGAFGAMIPSDSNQLRLDRAKKDRFGVPIASIDFTWGLDDLSLWNRAKESLDEMVEAFEVKSGIDLEHPITSRVYSARNNKVAPVPGSNHECGGARMGNDPATSVVDMYNRVWEAPNVLVCDSSCFPSLPHQNPTLTAMALAARAGRRLLEYG